MPKVYLPIPYPAFLESIVVYFLLRCRKKRCGCAFRRIKLIQANRRARPIYAKVDPENYEKLAGFNWLLQTANANNYAVKLEGDTPVRMHRIIMNAPKGSIVDHKDRNGLNNTKINLRFATRAQNNCNIRRKTKTKTSKYKGVSFTSKIKKWRVQIKYNGTTKHLGYFDNEEDAAKAYDEAAREYHGEFAYLNFAHSRQGTKSQRIGLFVKSLIL